MMERYRIGIPWVLERCGVRKWLKERVLHMPERYIQGWCTIISNATGAEITPDRWRQIEARLADLLYDGVLLKVG